MSNYAYILPDLNCALIKKGKYYFLWESSKPYAESPLTDYQWSQFISTRAEFVEVEYNSYENLQSLCTEYHEKYIALNLCIELMDDNLSQQYKIEIIPLAKELLKGEDIQDFVTTRLISFPVPDNFSPLIAAKLVLSQSWNEMYQLYKFIGRNNDRFELFFSLIPIYLKLDVEKTKYLIASLFSQKIAANFALSIHNLSSEQFNETKKRALVMLNKMGIPHGADIFNRAMQKSCNDFDFGITSTIKNENIFTEVFNLKMFNAFAEEPKKVNKFEKNDFRNVAIIAHVDHGKTTLVDRILQATKVFRDNQETGELIMDSNDLERERGITIFSKNAAVTYKGVKINVIDTPGHSDFGGEVERVLKSADGVILLVDAFEGPMPQTRFVLEKALKLNLKPIVVINKVDKPNCRPDEVHDAVFELFFNLDATEEQLDFPTYYGSGKNGWFSDSLTQSEDITPLLDGIIKYVPAPKTNEGPLQMQITSLDYSSFLGRIAIGNVARGVIKENQPVALMQADGRIKKLRVRELYVFEGMGKRKVTEVIAGDLCAVVGLEDFSIGDTIADVENPEALPVISVDEPTMSMLFSINNSPFFGKDGKFVTSRHLRDRLMKETEKNLALRVEDTESADSFLVYGRGILHLGILVETMRRERYELTVGQPQVLIKHIDGKKCEPYENLIVDVPSEFSGKVIDLVTQRKGEMHVMETKGEMQHLEFEIPSRGLIGLRSNMLTNTAGEAVMAHTFNEYKPWKGVMPGRNNGVLVSKNQAKTTAYSINKLQDKGAFFVDPGEEVYAGQIIAEHHKPGDLVVNACEEMIIRSRQFDASDERFNITPKVFMTLEECMEYIQQDECIEITPNKIRLRKIILDADERIKSHSNKPSSIYSSD